MFKVIWLMKRLPGITHAQFREHYENSHAVMGQKYYGHLWLDYRRNYCTETLGGSPAPGGGFGQLDGAYDCITEMIFRDEAAYEELLRIASDPAIGKAFLDDERKFLDTSKLIGIKVDCVDTGTGDGAATLGLTRALGAAPA